MKPQKPKLLSFYLRFLVAILGVSLCSVSLSAPIDDLTEDNAKPDRLSLSLIDAVYTDAIKTYRSIEEPVAALAAITEDENNTNAYRAKSYLSIAHLYWRYGTFGEALLAVDQALDLHETTDGTLLKARLLDAQGEERAAIEWYNKTLESTELEDEREFIRIRLAMIGVNTTNVDDLYALAQHQDQEFKNRAALTLAILGQPEKAIELYRPVPTSKHYFRQLLRLTEWGLTAEDYEKAEEYSWFAYENAATRFDGLYALTLIDETYRKQDKLNELLELLQAYPDKNRDIVDLQIDLLIDLELYDKAIALYHTIEQEIDDIEARYRLLQIYDISKRTQEMVQEYEQLIEEEPNVVLWYSGLASHYISIAEREKSLDVWQKLQEKNSDNIDILTHAGRYMNQMGFEPESLEMIKTHADTYGSTTTGQIFLFETHYGKGRYNEATEALNVLMEDLPDDSGDLRIVADGFERLQKYENALAIFTRLEELNGEPLGYDDRMRLAWLHSVNGNKEESLQIWQEIWLAESAPARRQFAESQFLLIAAELNVLADLAIELEDKLWEQTADRNEINLLVRIYTEIGDSFTAAEVVEEFALYSDMPDVERLRQLGSIYVQLNEYDKYDTVLRELAEIDTENRLEHIQNIVLNMVAFNQVASSDEKLADILHWLAELKKYDEEAVTGEFEASVLSMSGFTEQAIESYRLALIHQPQHSDNLLLMGELLKESNRTDEAVAVFQYVAEHSKNDNEFVVAIDGILNMIGQNRFGFRLARQHQATFRWAHRIILERITSKEDRFYLYTLLGEIATETLDTEAEFVAIENSISQAGIRRLSVLRELVTMATRDAGFFVFTAKDGDPERQLTYGRRLIGLRQQLPPEVYISLAKTLLERDDTLGAEKSLNLIRDITGDLDVNQTKADLFQEAGHIKQALAFYSHALTLNQDNNTLLIKTGVLREANFQYDVANTLYLNGMLNILQSQPEKLHADAPQVNPGRIRRPSYIFAGSRNTSVNRDYTTFYESFAQGVISTWPRNYALSESNFQKIRTAFRRVLANVETLRADGEDLPLSRYSQLNYLCQFIRRLCGALDRPDIVNDVDLELAKVFLATPPPPDVLEELANLDEVEEDHEYYDSFRTVRQFSNHLTRQYDHFGIRMVPELKDMLPSVFSEEVAVEQTDVLNEELVAAIESRDVETFTRLLNLTEPPKPVSDIFQDMVNEGAIRNAVRYASVVLSDREFTRLVSSAVLELNDEPIRLVRAIVQDPEFLTVLEENYGPIFETIHDFIAVLEDEEVRSYVEGYYSAKPSIWAYVTQRDDPEDLLVYLDHTMEQPEDTGTPQLLLLNYHTSAFQDLLKRKFNSSQREWLQELAINFVNQIDFQDEFAFSYVYQFILDFDIELSNVEVLREIVDALAARTELEIDVAGMLTDYFDGSKLDAFKTLIESDLRNNHYVRSIIDENYADEAIQLLENMIAGDCPTEEQANFLVSRGDYLEHYGQDEPPAVDSEAAMKSLISCFPDDEMHRMRLLQYTIGRDFQEKSKISQLLRENYERDKTNEPLRAAYFLWSKKQERYDTALTIAQDGGDDLRYQEVMDDILARNDESPNLYIAHPDAILHMIRDVEPVDDDIDRLDLGLPKNVSRAAAELAQMGPENTHTEVANVVRHFWRNINLQNLNQDPFSYIGNSLSTFLNWPMDQTNVDRSTIYGYTYFSSSRPLLTFAGYLDQEKEESSDEPERLIERTIENFSIGSELEVLIRSQDPWIRRSSPQWYELVARAYAYHEEDLHNRLADLTEEVLSNNADDHEFTLWMFLSNEVNQELTDEMRNAFFNWTESLSGFTNSQILNIAQFYSRLEDWENSLQYYKLLVTSIAKFGDFNNVRYISLTQSESHIDVSKIIDDVVALMPIEHSRAFVHSVLPLLRRFDDRPESSFFADIVILEMLDKVYPTDEVIPKARELSSSLNELLAFPRSERLLQGYEALPLIHIASIYAKSGELKQALEYIKPLFKSTQVEASKEFSGLAVESSSIYIPPPYYQVQAAIDSYVAITGITIPGMSRFYLFDTKAPSSVDLIFHTFDLLLDYEDTTWMDAVSSALAGWLDDESMHKQKLIDVLSVIAYETHQRGKTAELQTIAMKVNEYVRENIDSLSRTELQPIATLAIEVDFPLPPALLAEGIVQEFFSNEQLVPFLQTLSETENAEVAFATAKLIPIEHAGLSVLHVLERIGRAAGDETFVSEVNERIQSLEVAMEALETSVL